MVKSIFLENPVNLYNAVKDKLEVHDFNESGEVIDSGSAAIYSYKLWLNSKDFDYINQPQLISVYRLAKTIPISSQSIDVIKTEITDLTERYFPTIKITRLNVWFEYDIRRLNIEVDAYEKDIGLTSTVISSLDLDV